MKPETLAVLLLSLPVADIRRIKRTLRTLGSLGVFDYENVLGQIVGGCIRKREQRIADRDAHAQYIRRA